MVGKVIHEMLLSEKVSYGKHVSYFFCITFLWKKCMFTMNVYIDGHENAYTRLLLSGRISDHFFFLFYFLSMCEIHKAKYIYCQKK